jgi:hypothetical protein
LVFIGMNMPKDQMLDELQNALLTNEELLLGEDKWQSFPDPFPHWETPS